MHELNCALCRGDTFVGALKQRSQGGSVAHACAVDVQVNKATEECKLHVVIPYIKMA